MKKIGLGLFCFVVIFVNFSFSSAFTNFFIRVENTSFSLAALENVSSGLTISFSNNVPQEEEGQPYRIERYEVCDQYDDDLNCLEPVPDLCSYISIQPVGGEGDETGSSLGKPKGELNNPTDLSDDWQLSISAPCFEGECPNGYDVGLHGNPLPQSLKNQTFKCDLDVVWNGGIFQVNKISNVAHAMTSSVRVEAVFAGLTESQINPVIIVPGIMGSAYKNGNWVIDPVFHVYDNLIETLENNGYVRDENLFPWGYDWKNSSTENALLLKQKIDQVKGICGCEQVDVVAHSMGGLVTRAYVQSVNYENDIDQIIFLGTPHRGAPKDYLVWEAGEVGDDLQSRFLEYHYKKEAKKLGYKNLFDYIRDWPIKSVEELLPISNYLYSATTSQALVYPTGYPRNIFLENLNQGLVAFLEEDIDITNIISESQETITGLRITKSNKLPFWEHGYPENYDNNKGDRGLLFGQGDGTVPKTSASLGGNLDLIIDSSHTDLTTNALEKIFIEIHSGELVNPVKTPLPLKILFAKIFSPADFVVVAPDGKRVGKDFATGQEINEIPGAFYSGFEGDDEYVTIPNPLDGEYKIELQGTGLGGSYIFETTYITEATSTTAEISGITAPNQITNLKLDIDSAKQNQTKIERDVTLDVLVSDINMAYNLGWIKDVKVKNDLVKKAKLLIKFEKRRNGKYEKIVDRLLIVIIDKELDLLLKKGKINKDARDLLRKDLKYIINNN